MLTLRDRLLLLAFELRLAGWPATRVAALYDAAEIVHPGASAERPLDGARRSAWR